MGKNVFPNASAYLLTISVNPNTANANDVGQFLELKNKYQLDQIVSSKVGTMYTNPLM